MGTETKEVLGGKNFKWAQILSGFNDARIKEEKERAIMSGLPGNVPYESDMVKEWKPPFLFYKFFLYCFVLMILIFLCSYMYGFGDALLVSTVPYMIPLTMLIFIWELNIPRNISIMEMLYISFFGGIVCFLVIFFIEDITGLSHTDSSLFTQPLLSTVAKLLLVCVFLRRKSRGYGLNGVLVGAAVGAGYTMMETASDLFDLAEYAGQITGVMGLIIVRIIIAVGGDILWTAAYGGALALAKGRETLKGKHLGDSLFLICLIGTYLMKVLWDYDITNFLMRFSDSKAAVWLHAFLVVYQGKYILLTIIAWALFLFITRKGIEQAVAIADKAKAERRHWESKIAENYAGRAEIFGTGASHGGQKFTCSGSAVIFGRDAACDVRFAGDARGISSVHCEIRKQGDAYVLIDKNSSYGTFFKNGEKLEPGKPYLLQDDVEFYLASADNSYKVSVRKEQNAALQEAEHFGRRTNEIDGQEESGRNFYAACGVVLAVMFMALYMTSYGAGEFSAAEPEEAAEEAEDTPGYYGAWVSDRDYNIKDIILSKIDNVVSLLDIGIFKTSRADGITFTQDGMAYCTYDGAAIDYAKFTYSVVDDSTLHLQWKHVAMDGIGGEVAGVGANVSTEIGDETGFDVKYSVDGDEMQLDFAGQHLVLHK